MRDKQKPFFEKPYFGVPRLLCALALGSLALTALAPGAQAQNSQGTITDLGYFNSPTGGFAGPGSAGGNGASPMSPLVYDPDNGQYYGTASSGGANGEGDVYHFDPVTGAVTDVGDLGVPISTGGDNGEGPLELIYDPTTHVFYGTSSLGGRVQYIDAVGQGDVFQFNPAQTNPAQSVTDVGDFSTVYVNSTYAGSNGNEPVSGLAYDSANGLFYGTTQYGGATRDATSGAHGDGNVFSFDPTDTNPATACQDAGDFSAPVNPDGDLVYVPAANTFYGVTSAGGTASEGSVYVFTPSDSAATAISNAVSFTSATLKEPVSTLVLDPDNGFYYGTALSGANGSGCVYRFDPTLRAIADVGDFTGTNDFGGGDVYYAGGNGALPYAPLLYDASTQTFYGTAYGGGQGAQDVDGDVYSFTPADSNPATAIIDVGDFGNPSGGGNTGAFPDAALIYDPTTSLFFGTTTYGGTSGVGGDTGSGVVFSFAPAATTGRGLVGGGFTYTFAGYALGASSAPGQPVTFNFSVDNPAGPAPTGTVTFVVNGGAGVTQTLTVSNGTSSETAYVTSTLPVGTNTVTATYNGDSNYAPLTLTDTESVAASATSTGYEFPPMLQMVSLNETYSSLAQAFDLTPASSAPAYDTWNGSNYVLSQGATSAPALGQGFWIDPSSPVYVSESGTQPPTTVTIPLTQGWNLIGNPFYQMFPLTDISVTGSSGQTVTGIANANTAGLLYATLYTWQPTYTASGTYTPATAYTPLDGTASGASLSAFTGYWLYAFQGGETLTLTQLQAEARP